MPVPAQPGETRLMIVTAAPDFLYRRPEFERFGLEGKKP